MVPHGFFVDSRMHSMDELTIDGFRTAFNAESTAVRLVALISPT